MKPSLTLIVAAVLGGALSLPASAASSPNKEIATALIHAQMAAATPTLDVVQLHLHHVVNCVDGPHSKRFDAAAQAKAVVPCKGMGNGALHDAGSNHALRTDLATAVREAERGIHAKNQAAAHAAAADVVAALKTAQAAAQPKAAPHH